MKRICFYLCCSFFLCGAWPSFAQNSQPPADEGLAGVMPKDIHTRAKLHTELASMYFQRLLVTSNAPLIMLYIKRLKSLN